MASDSSSNLEIIISAADEASETLAQVGDSMQSMADQASAATASVNESLDGIDSAAEEMSGVLTTATSQPIEDLSAVDEAFATMANSAQGAVDSTQASFDSFMASSAAAAQAVGVSQDEIQAQMVATGQTADEVAAQMQQDNAETESSFSGLTSGMGKMMGAGTIIGGIGAAMMAPVIGSIDQAAERTSVLAQGLNSIQDIINANQGGNSQNATQIAYLTAQIDNYKASIAQANASMQENIGMTAVVEARHQKAAAAIQMANANIAKEEALLQPLIAKQQLGSASAKEISDQFSNMADQLTAVGIPFNTTYTALTGFLNVTGSVKESMLAMNDAAGLVLSGKIKDLPTAINDVLMAWRGMGMSGNLQLVVPDLQEGVAGSQALNQISTAVQGSSGVAFAQLTIQMAALQTNLQNLGAAFGKDLIPPLTKLVTLINSILEKMTALAQEHPKLAAAILIVVGAFGALVAIVGGLLVGLATVGLVATGIEAALPLLGIALAALTGPIGIVIAAVVGLAVIVTLIVMYHTQIWNAIQWAWQKIVAFLKAVFESFVIMIQLYVGGWVDLFTVAWNGISSVTETIWTALKTFFTVTWNWLKSLVTDSLKEIETVWNTSWTNLATFLGNIWTTIKNTVKGGVDEIITGINFFINALDAINISIPSIPIPGTKLATPSINLGFHIPDLPMLAEGGFVTQPTLALIGEAGPEAVVPLSGMGSYGFAGAGGYGGQPIIININGGIIPADQSAIKQIGDMLARSVIQTLRVRNYQP